MAEKITVNNCDICKSIEDNGQAVSSLTLCFTDNEPIQTPKIFFYRVYPPTKVVCHATDCPHNQGVIKPY